MPTYRYQSGKPSTFTMTVASLGQGHDIPFVDGNGIKNPFQGKPFLPRKAELNKETRNSRSHASQRILWVASGLVVCWKNPGCVTLPQSN
jgi:hypothetical protein